MQFCAQRVKGQRAAEEGEHGAYSPSHWNAKLGRYFHARAS